MARVPKPAKTSEIFLAPGHELTFPSHVQDLIEKIAAAHILKKASAAAAACLNIFIFFWLMTGTLLFHVESQAWARCFATAPISEKTKT